MPAFSGLWDGVHGDPYHTSVDGGAGTPPSQVPNPSLGGIVRVLMQKRGMFGVVKAITQGTSVASYKRVTADRPDVTVRGGYDYANRQNDVANQVSIANLGGGATTLENENTVANASVATLTHIFDTTLRQGYVGDSAENGVTADALSELNPT